MEHQRPDADELLQRISEQHHKESRAHFKIFFGAAAGVGKTYAMLSEALERKATGVDVVVGVVETHGRPETARLLAELERIPLATIEYRGGRLPELDIDAALARRPGLLLVDELAHTNVPGSRHVKRWQDVEELLDAGIDVYTTLNVQHVDSLNDVVAQVTGVTVRETVPDSILDRADEIELIDLPPDDLIQRLREGKVYIGPQAAERALESFFRKGNLIALRELALRKAAEQVDTQLESHRRIEGISSAWGVRERLLVAVGRWETGLPLVREARRLATALRAEWFVVHVERPGEIRSDATERMRIVDLFGFAEELGAQSAILSGHSVADELLSFARDHHATRILLGRTERPAWLERLRGSLPGYLIRHGRDLDVTVIDARPASGETPEAPALAPFAPRTPARHYFSAFAIVAITTLIALPMGMAFDRTNLIMVYLIGVLFTAARFGRGPGVLASVLSVAAFDFFFVPPNLTFAVSDTEYLITFVVMLSTALMVSTLTVRLSEQAEEARNRERRTAQLYALSRDLADASGEVELVEAAVSRISATFDADAVILAPTADGRVTPRNTPRTVPAPDPHELGVAQWVFDHGSAAGRATNTLPSARGRYEPLETTRGRVGVLGVYSSDERRFASPEQRRLLQTFAHQIALALERWELSFDAERNRLSAEREQMRNALLSSVSHDLRTPLASITGAASTLLGATGLDDRTREDLLRSISDEARRLNRLVANLLEMTRVESGGVHVRKEWHSIEEVVGSALTHLEDETRGRRIEVDIPADLPLAEFDDLSIEQVVTNLLDNALRYAPPDEPITVRAEARGNALVVEVLDRGPGIAPGEEQRVFEKFYRGGRNDREGVGLGLAICRAIVAVHGGTLDASARDGGGAVFRFTLPLGTPPPTDSEPATLANPAAPGVPAS